LPAKVLRARSGDSPTSSQAADVRLRVHGRAEIGFRSKQGKTGLGTLYHDDPLRIVFPTPASGDPLTAALVTTSGGLVGGDEIDVSVDAGPGSQGLVVAQAAEKIYRSTGPDCRIDVSLHAGAESWLEWLPQETILFDGARFRRRTTIDLTGTARVLSGEILVLGRSAMGERVSHGLVRDDWQVRRDGRLIWADRFRLDDDIDVTRNHPACLGGAVAIASVIYAAEDAADLLVVARDIMESAPADVRAACTIVNSVLVARWLSADALSLRKSFAAFWAGFRHAAAGLPEALPRLWFI
jgi:urease accessory protein